jgi:gamma-glutamylaminecyclotransferase
MEGQRFLGAARTLPRYRIHDCGGYPGLVEVDRGEAIEGEVWEVDLACLARLDHIEGVHYRLYARRPIALEPPHAGAPVESYYYLRKTTGLPDCGTCWPPRRECPE